MADFIGDVNIIDGTRHAAGEGGYAIAWAEGQPDLFCDIRHARFSKGQACHLAIRPEKVAISAEKPADARNAVQGKVLDIAYLGNLSTYHVELPDGQIIKAQTANTRRLSQRPLHLGRPGLAQLDRHRRRACWSG